MDFSFSSDQQLLKNSARAFLDEHCKPAFVRAMFDDPRGESEALWKEIAQLGWLGLSLPEEVGGSGLGMVEMALELLSKSQMVSLDEERKAAMVSNLLVVLCADREAQPVVNTGTLYQ